MNPCPHCFGPGCPFCNWQGAVRGDLRLRPHAYLDRDSAGEERQVFGVTYESLDRFPRTRYHVPRHWKVCAVIAAAITSRLPQLRARQGELFMALETGASVEELIGARAVAGFMGVEMEEEDDRDS